MLRRGSGVRCISLSPFAQPPGNPKFSGRHLSVLSSQAPSSALPFTARSYLLDKKTKIWVIRSGLQMQLPTAPDVRLRIAQVVGAGIVSPLSLLPLLVLLLLRRWDARPGPAPSSRAHPPRSRSCKSSSGNLSWLSTPRRGVHPPPASRPYGTASVLPKQSGVEKCGAEGWSVKSWELEA